MSDIVVIDEGVRQYLERLKQSSIGLLRVEGDETDVATLVELGLARVQEAENGRPARVKALPKAWGL